MASRGVVGFVGLDALSLKLASALIKSGFRVQAFEAVESLLIRGFVELDGAKCASPAEVAFDASTVFLVISEEESTDLLFVKKGVAEGLHKDAVLILQSSISPIHILEKNYTEKLGALSVVDVHVFEGFSEDSKEKIIVISSGRQESIQKAQPVLSALSEKVYIFEDEVGTGRKIKMVNDLVEGIHLVASIEAIFLGVRSGIHPAILYDIISNAAGSSRTFVQ